MKRKIGSLALVACLGLTLTGCKGSTNDVEKQVDKIEETIEDGKVFEKDYSYTVSYKSTTMGVSTEGKGLVVKDGDDFYLEVDFGEETSKVWIIKGDKEYTVYQDTADNKYYYTMDLNDVTSLNQLLDGGLKEEYKEQVASIESTLESCDNEKATCEVEKSLFGKVTYSIEEEGNTAKFILKGGKILFAEMKLDASDMIKMETSTEYDYGNQTVKAPNKVEFKEIQK